MSAFYLYERLKASNIRVPEDVSVISFDNTEVAQNMTPPLTSIDINKTEFATNAFELLLQRIANPQLSPQKKYIETHLVVRESIKQK